MDLMRQGVLREHTAGIAVLGTIIAYGLVIGTFLEMIPIYPSISLETSTLLSHAIAGVNAATVACLLGGWYWIRQGRVDRHRLAMGSAFALILLFLVLYLVRVGGGGTKQFIAPSPVHEAYLLMLGIHIFLSVLAVPLVFYVLLLGVTRTEAELRRSAHARIGRFAAGTWILSLVLGLVTYLLLEHLYGWEYVAAALPLVP